LWIGDNPAVAAGPPISLAWNPISEECHNFDLYEAEKLRHGPSRVLLWPAFHRHCKLRQAGFTRETIQKATEQAILIKKQRDETMDRVMAEPIAEAFETFSRHVRSAFNRKGREAERSILLWAEGKTAQTAAGTTSKAA